MDIDIIIVDDGCPEGSAEVATELSAKGHGIRVIQHPTNKVVAEAFNTGFDATKGDYLTPLALDDVFKPGALTEIVGFLDTKPAVDMAYDDMDYVDDKGNPCDQFKAESESQAFNAPNGIGVCWMFSRRVWAQGAKIIDIDVPYNWTRSDKFKLSQADQINGF